MEPTQNYVISSLDLHLFFARIMKEHAFFLKVGFLPPNTALANEGEQLFRQFEALLSRVIAVSDRVVSCSILNSGEAVTEFTDCAERQTQKFTGTSINRELTARTRKLRGRACSDDLRVSPELLRQVQHINRNALRLLDRLIRYKERILNGVKNCDLFTANYPLLIEHVLREARHYRASLAQIEGEDPCDLQTLCNREPFWNRVMMEHALFIRGLLDPCEEELIDTAGGFADEYCRLLEKTAAANERMMQNSGTLELTRKFRDFKCAGVRGIEECQIRALILPLLADHVLREANHYIRLLEE